MKVKCPNCGKMYWETTEAYDPDRAPNGSMLRLLHPWLRNSWPIFGDGIMPRKDGTGTASTLCAELDCVGCLGSLAPSGHLTVIPDPVPEPEILDSADSSELTRSFTSDGNQVPVLTSEDDVVPAKKKKRGGRHASSV